MKKNKKSIWTRSLMFYIGLISFGTTVILSFQEMNEIANYFGVLSAWAFILYLWPNIWQKL